VDVDYVFAGLCVSNRDSAAGWYARLFGRPADMLPNDAEATWQLSESSSLYLLADSGRAGKGVFTLMVTDLDSEVALVAARGVDTGPIEDVGSAGRRSLITDPDGNQIQVVQLTG
jgi:glyoxylase I family protein